LARGDTVPENAAIGDQVVGHFGASHTLSAIDQDPLELPMEAARVVDVFVEHLPPRRGRLQHRHVDEPYLFGPDNTMDRKRHEILAPDKYAWCEDVIERVPTAEHAHNWGGQFAVDKRLIHRCGREYWQRLLEVALSESLVLATRKRYTRFEIGIMFEFTWPLIMTGRRE
jgi:hypothetical protein